MGKKLQLALVEIVNREAQVNVRR